LLISVDVHVMPDGNATALAGTAWSRFAALPGRHPAIALLSDASRAKHLDRGAILVEESDDDTDVFLIASGRLRTVRQLDDGEEVWLADAGPGELVGELAALTGRKRTSTVIAASTVQVFAIDRATFLQIAQDHGAVGLALARLVATRLVQTSGHMADLFGQTVLVRVHRELVRLGTPSRVAGELVRISAPPSINDLRQRVHAGREATSRAVSELADRGVIIRTASEWIVMDWSED
jgi:CRP/FNR family transcriptional regulator, cyclic AMP receptor protein